MFFALSAGKVRDFDGVVSSRAKSIYFMENKFWPNWRDKRQNKCQTKYGKTVIQTQTKEEIVCGLRAQRAQRTPNGNVIKIFVFFIRPRVFFSSFFASVSRWRWRVRVDLCDIDRSTHTAVTASFVDAMRVPHRLISCNTDPNARTSNMINILLRTQQITEINTHMVCCSFDRGWRKGVCRFFLRCTGIWCSMHHLCRQSCDTRARKNKKAIHQKSEEKIQKVSALCYLNLSSVQWQRSALCPYIALSVCWLVCVCVW